MVGCCVSLWRTLLVRLVERVLKTRLPGPDDIVLPRAYYHDLLQRAVAHARVKHQLERPQPRPSTNALLSVLNGEEVEEQQRAA